MKKYFVSVALLAVIAACNSSETKTGSSDSAATSAPAENLSDNPDYQKGMNLITSNDCLTCHKVDEKMTGPAYRDVANKYENTDANVKLLADKIINGGTGVWGDIAMTPHAGLSQEDAEQMAKYVLLLKNK